MKKYDFDSHFLASEFKFNNIIHSCIYSESVRYIQEVANEFICAYLITIPKLPSIVVVEVVGVRF